MARVYKITDDQFIEEYVVNGLGQDSIAKKYGMASRTVQVRMKRLVKRGLISSELVESRKVKRKLPSDDILKELYLDKGMGCLKIAKIYGVCHQNVQVMVKRLGILDSSRQFKKKEGSRKSRRNRQHEFLVSTRRKRFKEVNGLCEECNNLIGDGSNYATATYHHILPIAKGGHRNEENCMVLHFECHNDPAIFERLHGYDVRYLDNYKKE